MMISFPGFSESMLTPCGSYERGPLGRVLRAEVGVAAHEDVAVVDLAANHLVAPGLLAKIAPAGGRAGVHGLEEAVFRKPFAASSRQHLL